MILSSASRRRVAYRADMLVRAKMLRAKRIDEIHKMHRDGRPIPDELAMKVCPVFLYITGGKK